eukprot:GFUD01030169.1.p1 GENE.GFUD01030169.1~~GFUD01030169.1.p1  ORF type:complete len:277 (-),score=28.97 GFUD01030169.1:259-1089(-)
MTSFDRGASITKRFFILVAQILVVSVKLGKVKWSDTDQFEFGNFGQCSNLHQRTAFDVHTRHRCNTREEVVELELPPDGGVIQVIPSHVSVARCSGSCMNNPSHSCTPLDYRMKEVEVMMVTSTFSEGPWQTLCSTQRVREDISCSCGCSISAADCSSIHHKYDGHSCKCSCQNTNERYHCLQKDKIWDSETCSCLCRPDTWKICSTGYLFDGQNSCDCVPTHYQASIPVNAIMGVALITGLGVVSSLMYMKKVKRRDGRRESLARVLEEDSDEEI